MHHLYDLPVPTLPPMREIAVAQTWLTKMALTASELTLASEKINPNPTEASQLAIDVDRADKLIEGSFGKIALHDVDATEAQNDIVSCIAKSGVDSVDRHHIGVFASASTASDRDHSFEGHRQTGVVAPSILLLPKILQEVNVKVANESAFATLCRDVGPLRIQRTDEATGTLFPSISFSPVVARGADSNDGRIGFGSVMSEHRDPTAFSAFSTAIKSAADCLCILFPGDNDTSVKSRRILDELSELVSSGLRQPTHLDKMAGAGSVSFDHEISVFNESKSSNEILRPTAIASDSGVAWEKLSGIDGKLADAMYVKHARTSSTGYGHSPGVTSTRGSSHSIDRRDISQTLKTAIDLGLIVFPRILLVKYAAWDRKDRAFCLAVDLDGTLAHTIKPHDNKKIGEPRPDAKKWMDAFHKAGAKLIIFTVRGDDKLVGDWLKKHEIPYDHINENPDQPPESSGKVFADAYWDNRAYNAEDLEEFGPLLLDKIEQHADKDEAKDDPVHGTINIKITHTRILLMPDDLLQEILEHGVHPSH